MLRFKNESLHRLKPSNLEPGAGIRISFCPRARMKVCMWNFKWRPASNKTNFSSPGLSSNSDRSVLSDKTACSWGSWKSCRFKGLIWSTKHVHVAVLLWYCWWCSLLTPVPLLFFPSREKWFLRTDWILFLPDLARSVRAPSILGLTRRLFITRERF